VDRTLQEVNKALEGLAVNYLVITGHSLGASIAEGLFGRRKEIKNLTTGCKAETYTFDSPGLPASLRKEWNIEMPCQGLRTLNAVINPVNMLFPPVASRFFTCGYGSRFTIQALFYNLRGLLGKPVQLAASLLISNIKEHPISTIISHLADNRVVEENPSDWPVWSGSALSFLGETVRESFKAIGETISRPPERRARERERQERDAEEKRRRETERQAQAKRVLHRAPSHRCSMPSSRRELRNRPCVLYSRLR